MRPLVLSSNWLEMLQRVHETGMGYQIATIVLRDGTRFEQVAIVDGCITQIRGRPDIPFSDDSIQELVVTHNKWDFANEG
jgi:hypothetical protein